MKMTKIKCLSVGCGTKPERSTESEEWVNADICPIEGVIELNLDKVPYDFKDNTFDMIKMYSVLEHLGNYENAIKELKRISKDGAKWKVRVPFPFAPGNDSEFHRIRFRYNSFGNTPKKFLTDAEQNDIYRGIETVKRYMSFDNTPLIGGIIGFFANKLPRVYNNSFLRFLFPAHHIYFILRIRK